MLRILPDSLVSLTFPQDCHVCHDEVSRLSDGISCDSCWNQTRIFNGTETLCDKCGAFLFASSSKRVTFCGRCNEHQYDRASAIGFYHDALSASVIWLKRVPRVSARLRHLFIAAFERMAAAPTLIVPVPLSPRRLRERGFNQASILGRIISRHAHIKLDECSLVRSTHTPMHRAGMDRKARAATVQRAFQVVRPNLVAGHSVLLVDDVFTSGETASICASLLKKNGATTVSVLTLARAEKMYS